MVTSINNTVSSNISIINKNYSYPFEYRFAKIYHPIPNNIDSDQLKTDIRKLGMYLHQLIKSFKENFKDSQNIKEIIIEDAYSQEAHPFTDNPDELLYLFQEFVIIFKKNGKEYYFVTRISFDPCYSPRACKTWIRLNLKKNNSNPISDNYKLFLDYLEIIKTQFISKLWEKLFEWIGDKFKISKSAKSEDFEMFLFGSEQNFEKDKFNKENLIEIKEYLKKSKNVLTQDIQNVIDDKILGVITLFTNSKRIKDIKKNKNHDSMYNKWFVSKLTSRYNNGHYISEELANTSHSFCIFHINQYSRKNLNPKINCRLAGYIPSNLYSKIHSHSLLMIRSFAKHWLYKNSSDN